MATLKILFTEPKIMARFFINIYSINYKALRHALKNYYWKDLIERQSFNKIHEICQELQKRRVFLEIDEIKSLYDCQNIAGLDFKKESLLLKNAPDYKLEIIYRDKHIHSLLKLMQLYRSENVDSRGGICAI